MTYLHRCSYAERLEGIKKRARGEKFQEHYNHAQLFFNFLASYEKIHLANAISFELSHCEDPVVYKSNINVLNNIDLELVMSVAANVGGDVPTQPSRRNHGKKSRGLSQEGLHAQGTDDSFTSYCYPDRRWLQRGRDASCSHSPDRLQGHMLCHWAATRAYPTNG